MTREEAIEVLKEYRTIVMNCLKAETPAFDMAIEALSAEYEDYEHASPVDIKEPLKVPVVRCKDCRHANKSMFCSVYLQPRLSSDFCNYGERREP